MGGRLNIESVQEHIEQTIQQSGAGARVQVSFGTAWEASGHVSQSQASGSSDTVTTQSGLFAGEGGYHINAGSVHLKGGAIASTAPKAHNELTAGRLTFEDIHNRSSYTAQNIGLSGGYNHKPTDGSDNGPGFNPTLPQYEQGTDRSTTYAVLSEGRLNIGGKKTTVQELGIRGDSSGTHRAATALPDLAEVTERQQIAAKATADITSAVRTFSGNRQKAAAEERAKAAAEYEGRLKAQNDGSYEAFSRLSESEQQSVLISESEAYRTADAEAKNWGLGGSHSRAVNAATGLITGALGGQTNLQTAANALAPYAAATIGRQFGHGENSNEAAQIIGHFALGATLAYINGGDPLTGGSAAVAAEKAAQYLAQQYNDGQTAIDPQTGEFNPNLLPEQIKEEIKSTTGDNGATLNAQIAGVIGQNAVENNRLKLKSTTSADIKQAPSPSSQNGVDLLGTLLPAHAVLLSNDRQIKELNVFRSELRKISSTGLITAGYGSYILVGGKHYLIVSGSSIGTSAITSTLIEGNNYMLSDLVYDATLGIFTAKILDKSSGKMITWSETDERLFKQTLNFKKQIINYGFDKAGSGTIQKYLADNDITLIEVPEWREKIKK